MKTNWLMLTGEYPPHSGGVADYTRVVGEALVGAGDSVEVWAPPCEGPELPGPINVRRLPDHFGSRGLALLSKRLAARDPNRIVVVQYVPHAFACRAMNVRFCAWLMRQRRERIWTMFHEVAYPFERTQPLRHRFLAGVNHTMAAMVARASRRAFISIPAWERKIRTVGSARLPIEWSPVPSNVSVWMPPRGVDPNQDSLAPVLGGEGGGEGAASPVERIEVAKSLGVSEEPLALTLTPEYRGEGTGPTLAHFGTYGGHAGPIVAEVLKLVLQAEPSVSVRLLGRGSEAFAKGFAPERVTATGELSAAAVAAELAAADVILQPYIDGASSRRSSLMAALALGRAVVTTEGHHTESLWRETGAVALAPVGDAPAIAGQTIALLRDSGRRVELSTKAAALYDARFDVRHTVKIFRDAAEGRR